jgi:hypothetical protein
MMDKKAIHILSIRTDQLWMSWADRLAREAGRKNRSELVRDVILAMVILPDLGDTVTNLLKSEAVHYGD